MFKLFKFLGLLIAFAFSGFILIGFVMYVISYMFTDHEKGITNAFKKFPRASHLLRESAAFTSEIVEEKPVSEPRTKILTQKKLISQSPKLNFRQNKILNMLKSKEKLDMSEIQKSFPKINVRTLRRDLSKLESENYITKIGKTKGSFYRLS